MRYVWLIALVLVCKNLLANNYLEFSPEAAMKRLALAQPGDTIFLANGTYPNAVIKFSCSGTKEQPVIFMAQHGGKVFFEGNSRLSFSGNYIVVDGFVWQNGGKELNGKSVVEFKINSNAFANYSGSQNCVIDNYNNTDKSIDNKWVSVYGQYNVVKNCLLKAKDNLGATLTVWLQDGLPAYHLIEYNYFFQRINGPQAYNGLESMRIGDSKTSMTAAYCTVQFNRFEECDGEIEIISNKSCFNKYVGNTFYNCAGGLTLRHGNNCIVDGNFFFGVKKKLSYGIRVIGENHVISNNYLYGLQGGPYDKFRAPVTLVSGLETPPLNGYFPVKNAIIKDNFIINCNGPAIRVGSGKKEAVMEPQDVIINNNTVYNDSPRENPVLVEIQANARQIKMTENYFFGAQSHMKGWKKADSKLLIKKNNLYVSKSGKPVDLPLSPSRAGLFLAGKYLLASNKAVD